MFEIQELICFVIAVFNGITRAVHFAYLLSVVVGQRLAECIVLIVKSVWIVLESCANVLNILYEDYIYFLQDVAYKTTRIANILWGTMEACINLFVSSYCSLKSFIFCTKHSLIAYINTLLAILGKIYDILVRIPDMLKYVIVFIGTSCYFALQLIPVAIVYVLSMIVFMVGRSFEEIFSIISLTRNGIITLSHGVLQFFMELPPEAVIGLTFGCFALYISVKYVSLITEVMKQSVFFCRSQIQQAFMYLWLKLERLLLWIFTNDNAVPMRDEAPVPHPTASKCQEESEYSDLCVVCQDRQKCIIIFPCRHLCLCRECCVGVQQQNGRCPLCRRTVIRIMKVYV